MNYIILSICWCHILNVKPLGINVNSTFIHLKSNLLKFYIDKICDCSQYSSQYFCITYVCIHINTSDTIQNICMFPYFPKSFM